MKRSHRLPLAVVALVGATLPAAAAFAPRAGLRHDPRTTAKKLSQGLEIDGAGRFELDYKALHYNADMFQRASKAKGFMDFLNAEIWGKMGTAKLEFALAPGEVELAPGEYRFGINMTPAEEFSVVFWPGPAFKTKLVIPLAVERDQKPVPYLTVALLATDEVDVFALEARCGPFRGTVDVKVPYLSEEHDHPAGGAPPAKKP